MLVRLFTLESPYPRSTTATQLMRLVAKNQLRPIDVKKEDLPHPGLKDVIDGCLKFAAVKRYTFVQIEDRLGTVLDDMEKEKVVEIGGGGGGGGSTCTTLIQGVVK